MTGFFRESPWGFRLVFLGLALVLLFIRLLPLGNIAGALPGPDLLLCVIMAWVVRRPDFLPLGLIVLVVLSEDLILMRPPGLWTALVVMASEFLRSRAALTRELNFVIEWMLVTGLMMAMLLAYRLVFALALLPQPAFGFSVVQILWSALAYPIVVGLSQLALNLHKPGTGETDDLGRRM
ncbi:MAG: rod shape-determining protein MreD [Paracoccaceae bacterium]